MRVLSEVNHRNTLPVAAVVPNDRLSTRSRYRPVMVGLTEMDFR